MALILLLVFPPASIVVGHIAKKQIRQTGEQGSALANVGLFFGYTATILYLLMCVLWVGLMPWDMSLSTY
ncbi:DUF4190 domain-containing protein [Polymorphospora sp. NPDC051019]|uniref:DUF4190 domain-containing protein n=1 Tax=Polymorphospora sp. NPDC051019 TaxID=3155725 RepID=UPI003425ECE3